MGEAVLIVAMTLPVLMSLENTCIVLADRYRLGMTFAVNITWSSFLAFTDVIMGS